jgi:tetratricopeptide (TPR) repeat protein
MLRIALKSLTTLVLWAAVLATGADGAMRLVSTGQVLQPQPQAAAPAERAMLADAADGRFERVGLIESALIASGTTDTHAIARYELAVDRFTNKLRPQLKRIRSTEARAELLLVALHRQLLDGRYIASQSDIRVTLDRGDYNCLSSVILYVAVGRTLGIDIQPAVLPGHIIATLAGESGPTPVETTYCQWFAAVRQGRVHSAPVPAMEHAAHYDRRQATRLTDPELIALVYYNQGYEHLTHNRFADAWAANHKALLLDPDSHRSRGNFLATINNWSLALCKRGEFVEARRLVSHGLQMAPSYAPLQANNRHVHRMWVERLAADGNWQAAAEVLERATHDWPNEPYFAHYLRSVSQRHIGS